MTRAAHSGSGAAVAVFLVSVSTGVLAAQTTGVGRSRQPELEEHTDILVVEVPVQVLRDGEPVRGLTAENFVIRDGKEHRPTGFEVVDLELASSARYWTEEDDRAMPIAARRHFLLLFDLSFSRPDGILRARDAVQDLVVSGMHPSDVAAVATYSERSGFRVVLNFTGDRPQILAAVEKLGLMDPVDRFSRDPLGLVAENLQGEFLQQMAAVAALDQAGQSTRAAARRAGNLQIMLENIQDMRIATIRTGREQQQQQILAFTSSLRDVARLLSEVEGRCHVVLLSEGFDSSAILGNSTEDRARVEELRRAVEDGQTWRVDNDERFGSSMAMFGLTQMLDEFRHAGATIQAVDIGGLRAQGVDNEAQRDALVRQDGLFVLANDTGGRLYRNTNDLTVAMDEMLRSTSVTYLLAYQPEDVAFDGSFRPIEVRLVRGPKGAKLYHRDGYYTPLPYGAASQGVRRLRTAQILLGGEDGGELDVAVLAPLLHAAGERARVGVVVELGGPALLRGSTQDPLPLEIYAYVLREDGSVADYLAQALGVHLAETRSTLASGGLRFWGDLELPPGDYALRVLGRNSETGAYGVATVALGVPPVSADQRFVGTPLFRDPAGSWVLAWEQGESGSSGSPLVLRDAPFLPAARPVLRPGAAGELLLLGQGIGGASLEWRARLENEQGELVATPRLEIVSSSTAEETGTAQLLVTVTVDAVPPGRYRLRLFAGEGASALKSSTQVEVP